MKFGRTVIHILPNTTMISLRWWQNWKYGKKGRGVYSLIEETEKALNSGSINTMNTTIVEVEPVAIRAWAEKRMIYLELTDGRIVGFPADRFQILSQASENQLKKVQVEVSGYALRWEELDEDLTVAGVVAGRFQLPLPRQAA
jgi:Protein of unknown function (DUF2442)